ncbi:hypothetical protein ABZS76_21745 [Streptomyces sp. NPDC005562]|uniref:hypothetical protein n=1 Tax=unclassified Streptomyces TaxID=2593676 RepID=UPI0033B07FB1
MSESAARKALAAIERALVGIDQELERHVAGRGSVSGPEQLGRIRDQLAGAARELSTPPLPSRAQRPRGIGRVVTDSWPYDNPLGGMILEAEQLYLEA